MRELIYRDDAIEALGEEPEVWMDDDDYTLGQRNQWQYDVTALKAVPSAQLEIIRCKDCKHWIPYDWMFSEVWQSCSIDDYPEDEIGCNYCDMAMKANDFCSRGERRTNG